MVIDDPDVFFRIVKILDHFSKTMTITFDDGNDIVFRSLDEAKQMQVSLRIPRDKFLLFEENGRLEPSKTAGSHVIIKTDDFMDSIQSCIVLCQNGATSTLESMLDRFTLTCILKDPFECLEISSKNQFCSISSSLSLVNQDAASPSRSNLDVPNAVRWIFSVISEFLRIHLKYKFYRLIC